MSFNVEKYRVIMVNVDDFIGRISKDFMSEIAWWFICRRHSLMMTFCSNKQAEEYFDF